MRNKKEVLTEVFCDVLEKQAFMFAEPATEEDIPKNITNCITTKVNFYGDKSGMLFFTVPTSMSRQLAANMIGLDIEDIETDDQAYDSLRETLNIICGNLLTELFGVDMAISPTIPETLTTFDKTWDELAADENVLGFLVDDVPVFIDVNID